MNLVTHSSVGLVHGWRRLAQALLGLALLGGGCVALSPLIFGEVPAAIRLIHVSIALVMWPLAMLAAAAAHGLCGRLAALARFGLFLGGAGALLSVLVVLLADSRDAYSSALPILRHPVHGASIGLFLLGVMIAFAARLGGALSRTSASGGTVWYALLPLAVAVWSAVFAWGATAELEGPVRLSYAFWGPANLIPFLFAVLIMQGWIWLVDGGTARRRWSVWTHVCVWLAVAPVLLVLQIQLELPISDPEYFAQFARLVTVGIWPAALLLFVSLLPRMMRIWHAGPRADVLAIVGSAVLFFAGVFIGWGGDDTGTIFQAQTHLSAGALLLVSQVLGGRWGGAGAESGALASAPAPSVGQVLAIAAVFAVLAAGFGLYGLSDRWGFGLPEGAFGVARGALAAAGVLLLALLWLPALRRLTADAVRVPARLAAASSALDMRVRAAVATLLAIVLVGAVIALLPSPDGRAISPVGGSADEAHRHVVDKRREEVRLRFEQGVAMLHARRHDEAATAFHRVLQLAPEMPEAHVNMGFAMLGVKDYKVARDFFEGAIELRTDQLNAYYGLALAYEGLGNIEGAIGAMRTYQHLTAPDDPFLPEAMRKLRVFQGQRSGATASGFSAAGGQ